MEEVMQKEPLEAPLDKGAKERKNIESWLTEAAIYIGLFLLTLILFLTVKPLIEVQRKGAVAQAIIALGHWLNAPTRLMQ